MASTRTQTTAQLLGALSTIETVLDYADDLSIAERKEIEVAYHLIRASRNAIVAREEGFSDE